MGDCDRELFFIGQRLQGLLPQLVAHTEAFSPISGDQQFVSRRIELFAAVLPPPSDALHGKLRRLMIDPDEHSALIRHEIVDAVRDGFAIGERSGNRRRSPASLALWAAIRAPGSSTFPAVRSSYSRPRSLALVSARTAYTEH